jgi:hypothetical protein
MRAMRTSILAFVFAGLAACAGGGSDDPGDPTPDAPSSSTPVCGDGTCAAQEVGVCPQDCGSTAQAVCGNQMCEQGESATNCPNDCAAQAMCGNGTCETGENATNCPGDCGGGMPGTCPADPFECFTCFIDGTGCPPGMDQASCTECVLGGI